MRRQKEWEEQTLADGFIRLEHISKSFDGELVLDDLSLEIERNEFVTLLGPSGCGKTTTLRIIGGFEKPDEGRVYFDGVDITDWAPHKRPLNTVFQKYALFPHMDVAANVGFGLRMSGVDKAEIAERVKRALALVNMEGFDHRRVNSLSGGQQQRIAIARAIVNEPKVLLLDEPLGALDLKLRREMQYELVRLKKELGITFLYVTHDQEEALMMSDRVVVMNQGYIQQVGTPEDIYNEPENAFVADFVGDSNIFDAVMMRDGLVAIQGKQFPCVDTGFGKLTPVDVQIRPEDVDLIPAEPDNPDALNGIVTDVNFKGIFYEMLVQAGDEEWQVNKLTPTPEGSHVRIMVDPYNIQIMKKPESEDEEILIERDEEALADYD